MIPGIDFREAKGLSKQQRLILMKRLRERAEELAATGSVMVMELVQVAEDFLLENNVDPTLSAWEQMKAREADEKERQREEEDEMTMLMDSGREPSQLPLSPSASSNNMNGVSICDSVGKTNLEREVLRQMHALKVADDLRKDSHAMSRISSGGNTTETPDDGSSEGDEDDFDDYDYDAGYQAGASRYKIDFVELGLLGRG